MSYVYILQSENDSKYYIGSTNDLTQRMKDHCRGKVKTTKSMLPVKLMLSKEYNTITEARKVELKLKSFKSKKIIDKIVREGYIKL